jgi:hypothetical protein
MLLFKEPQLLPTKVDFVNFLLFSFDTPGERRGHSPGSAIA